MKAYGVKRKDFGCCPGHDKFPPTSYNSSRSKKARAKSKVNSHQKARAMLKQDLQNDRGN
jgi:hypothetical protein